MKGGEKGVNVKYNKNWNFYGGQKILLICGLKWFYRDLIFLYKIVFQYIIMYCLRIDFVDEYW